jgi:hypothetical protein
MSRFSRWTSPRLLAAALALFVASPLLASEKFVGSDDAKEKDEPQKFLSAYDKLQKCEEADWCWFSEDALKGVKSASVPEFERTGRGGETRNAAGYGKEYLEDWLDKSKLEWKIGKGGGDLVIQGNIFNAWEPSGAARFWGGWMANPGCGIEIQGKKGGKVVFEIRQKARGSTVPDAVENGLEDVVKEIERHR